MTLDVIKVAHPRAYPPRVSAFTEPFWESLARGVFITTRCARCDRSAFPPKPICPHCWCRETQWIELGRHGLLYSWTRIHAAPTVFLKEAPYDVGIVDLDQGVRLACRLHPKAGVPFAPGLPMEMVVLAYDDGPLFAARPL